MDQHTKRRSSERDGEQENNLAPDETAALAVRFRDVWRARNALSQCASNSWSVGPPSLSAATSQPVIHAFDGVPRRTCHYAPLAARLWKEETLS